jgi:hypothetical protein
MAVSVENHCGKRVDPYQGERSIRTIEVTATTTEQNQAFDVTYIKHLIIDGAADVAFSFDESLDSDTQPQGLASAYRLLVDLRAQYIAHCAMGEGTHTAADTTNEDAAAIASSSLADMLTAAHSLKDKYNAHDAESGTFHPAEGTAHQTSAADPTTLPTLITLLNEISSDLTAHMADEVAHTAADATNVITVANAGSGLTIKTSAKIEDLPVACSVLYFRAASGTSAFRACGLGRA